MTSPLKTFVALVLIGSVLAGCAGDDGDGGSTAAEEAGSVVPTQISDATSADADLDGEADEGAVLTAEQLCGFLAEESPAVIDLQPPEYAASVFGLALIDFYGQQGLLTDIDGAEIDDLVAEGCPDVGVELLPVLGARSFAELYAAP